MSGLLSGRASIHIALVTLPAYCQCILVPPSRLQVVCSLLCSSTVSHSRRTTGEAHCLVCNSRSAQWKVCSIMTALKTFLSITLLHENPIQFQVARHLLPIIMLPRQENGPTTCVTVLTLPSLSYCTNEGNTFGSFLTRMPAGTTVCQCCQPELNSQARAGK
jgi:hypothetical protein